MNNHFERSQGLRFCRVHNAGTYTVPPAAVQAGALAGERCPGVLPLDDSPSGEPQEKTPCSSRPIRFSTARAPSSVRENAKGVSKPKAFFEVVSQVTAPSTSPSKSSTAFSNTVATRSKRPDSSGASVPAALRRARVLSAIPSTDAKIPTERPLSSARDSRALKGSPRSI